MLASTRDVKESIDESPLTNWSSCRSFKDLYNSGIIGNTTLAFTESMGFVKTSPVQEAVIPTLIRGAQDVAVEACTGSGKTLAFLIPIVEVLLRLSKRNDNSAHFSQDVCRVGAICLGPTRELVVQIHEVLVKYLEYVKKGLSTVDQQMSTLLFTGGHEVYCDIDAIQLAGKSLEYRIVIATPGRLSHLIKAVPLNQSWTFRDLELLIFDEADRLLIDRASFERQLSCILSVLPKQRRTGLFSATLSAEMKGVIKAGMRNPSLIRVLVSSQSSPTDEAKRMQGEKIDVNAPTNHSIPTGLSNYFVVLERHDKFAFLLKFLLTEIFPSSKKGSKSQGKKCILFFLTCSCVGIFYKFLSEVQSQKLCPQLQGGTIERLFGKMPQKARLASSKRFGSSSPEGGSLLIATDVAARGLDFPDVEWIVQFDAPLDPSVYIHRIGRTARAGRSGTSIMLISPPEEACVPFLQNRQVPLQNLEEFPSLLEKIEHLSLSEAIVLPQVKNAAALDEFPLGESHNRGDDNDGIHVPHDDRKRMWEVFRCLITSDRDILLKASAAFVSFIRAYKEHQLQYIFPFKELEIGELATSLSLLRIPRVREILGKSIKGFCQSSLDPQAILFRDKHRAMAFNLAQESGGNREKSKKQRKKAVTNEEKVSEKHRTRSEKRRAKRRRTVEEWDELALEERLFKKFRRGHISKKEYEMHLSQAGASEDTEPLGRDSSGGRSAGDEDSKDSDNETKKDDDAKRHSKTYCRRVG